MSNTHHRQLAAIGSVCALAACVARSAPPGRQARVEGGPLRVGIATVDITPEGPVWMGGFAARKRPSEGVWKNIEAACVVFDNGATRIAFVAVDLCKIYEPQLVDLRAAAQEAGIGPQQVMINASHNHSGPTLRQSKNADYCALFKDRTEPLFGEAVRDLKPAVLHYAVGMSAMGVNRRQLNEEGRCVGMRPEPRKPIDPDVPVLRISSPEGNVRAIVFGYACHPSTMNDYTVGPDYVGYARDWIAAAYPGAVPVFLRGCGGDIKTRYTTASGRFGCVLLDPVQLTAELGHELGRAVVVALTVPTGPVPAEPLRASTEGVAHPVHLSGIVEKVRVPDKEDPEGKSHEIYMGAWRIGDLYVFGSQCELCSSIGLRIKRELAPLRVWTNGYTHWGGGYIPDAASYPEGGYEVNASTVSPQTEDIVVGNACRYIRRLRDGWTGVGEITGPQADAGSARTEAATQNR